jgi:uncharacterized damage-inducible protein DinB
MRERPVRRTPEQAGATPDHGLARCDAAYEEFGQFARRINDQARLDDMYADVLDRPPRRKTFGGTIAHVITHNMHHRCEVMHMPGRLGVPGLIEGDALSWEAQARQ